MKALCWGGVGLIVSVVLLAVYCACVLGSEADDRAGRG